jgi:hypothetical protein
LSSQMRRRRPGHRQTIRLVALVLLIVAVACAAAPAVGSARRSSKPRCHLRGRSLVRSRNVHVVQGADPTGMADGAVLACYDPVGKTRILQRLENGTTQITATRFRLAGTWVSFLVGDSSQYRSSRYLRVADVKAGRRYDLFSWTVSISAKQPIEDPPSLADFLSPHGEVVAAVKPGDDIVEIRVFNGRTGRLADSDTRTNLDPASLALRALTASWTDRGVRKTIDLP